MNSYEFHVAVRVRHPTLAPSDVTEAMGVTPSHSWQAGEPRRSLDGTPLEGLYRGSYWIAPAMPDERVSSSVISLDAALMASLRRLQHVERFIAGINADGGSVDLSVSIFGGGNIGLELSAPLLLRMGRLGVAVALDVYS